MLASSSVWNKDAGIVMVMRFVLRECQLFLAWFSTGAVEVIRFSTIDVCLDLLQVSGVTQKGENLP